MLLYLDLNCFNRPFDDQSQKRIARETSAVYSILQRIVDGIDALAWSGVLGFENSQHPLTDRRTEIAHWAERATVKIGVTPAVAERARELHDLGLRPLDAAHVACAEAAGCDFFLSCDDRLLRTAKRLGLAVVAENPVIYSRGRTNG